MQSRVHWACLGYREGNLEQKEGQKDCSLGRWYSAWLGMDEHHWAWAWGAAIAWVRQKKALTELSTEGWSTAEEVAGSIRAKEDTCS